MTEKILNKILFVDDDTDILSIIKYSLDALEGVTVLTSSKGEEGVEIALAESPDLIILDVMMPNMDGIAVLKALRLLPNCKTTPIAFLTAKVQKSEIEEFMRLGVIGVLEKPFDPIGFPDEILKLWRKSQGESTY
jgi:two-component system, OmpR family, response regulator